MVWWILMDGLLFPCERVELDPLGFKLTCGSLTIDEERTFTPGPYTVFTDGGEVHYDRPCGQPAKLWPGDTVTPNFLWTLKGLVNHRFFPHDETRVDTPPVDVRPHESGGDGPQLSVRVETA